MKPEYKIGIIGSGKMGRDIFDFLSDFPFQMCLLCETINDVELQSASFQKKQNRALKYGLIDEENYHFRSEYTEISTDLNDLSDCELIIEAVTEDLNLKRKLFQDLGHIVLPNCIITSNTSSISPDKLFTDLKHPENGMGLHFFFPVKVKDWVEVNLPEYTSEKAVSFIQRFLERIGKKNLLLSGENHFVINRIFLKMQASCCQLLIEGKLTASEIDRLVKTHLFPIGVFELFDHVGIDVMLQSVMSYIQFESKPDFFRPMIKLLREKQKSGKLGLKTKTGFYDYPVTQIEIESEKINISSIIFKEISFAYLDGVFDVLHRGICSRQELEQIIMNYMLIEKSPFELANEIGYTSK